VRTSVYLVRVMPHVDERNDPARIFACMSVAAEAIRIVRGTGEDRLLPKWIQS